MLIRVLGRKLSVHIRIVQTLNLRMISKSDFTAPGVLPPPAYTQAIPEESGNATPTFPDPQTLPSNPDEIRARLHAFRKTENVQMIEVLRVGREEMPEAIKVMQRALQREGEGECFWWRW